VHSDAWLTEKVRPAMMTLPVRGAAAFAVTMSVAWPVPTPLVGVTLIHSTLEFALQAQPDPVVTDAATVPPGPPMACDVGATL
jgi:hypothetical protein